MTRSQQRSMRPGDGAEAPDRLEQDPRSGRLASLGAWPRVDQQRVAVVLHEHSFKTDAPAVCCEMAAAAGKTSIGAAAGDKSEAVDAVEPSSEHR